MVVITTHVNADFDTLASMIAARKLYPEALVAFPAGVEKSVRDFLKHSPIPGFSPVRAKDIEALSPLSLAFSALVIGFTVSILEAACTGQVYVPTIVYILKSTSLRLKALSYLLLYNLMFILPLLAVFVLSFLGFSSKQFNDLLKRNIGPIKFLMFGLFFSLGVLILWIG